MPANIGVEGVRREPIGVPSQNLIDTDATA